MSEVVDSIIAELVARDRGYVATFQAATKAHQEFSASIPKIDSALAGSGQAAQTYANRHKRAAGEAATASEQSAERIKRAAVAEDQAGEQTAAKRKRRTTQEVADAKVAAAEVRAQARLKATEIEAGAKTEAAAVVAAEKVKQDAIRATARVQAGAQAYGPPRPINIIESGAGKPQLFGFGNPSQGVSERPLPVGRSASVDAGAAGVKATAAAEAEINHALIDQIGLQARLTAARGEDRQIIQDELFQIQQLARYTAAGVAESEAMAKVQQDLLAIETLRTRNAQVKAAADAAALEKQIAAQSAQVSKGVSLFAGALVGGITVAELSHLNDEYIRFSNSLKVAGVSALEFDGVQEHLLQTSVRTGTNIGALSDTYRSIALAAHDLGASQEDILRVTDAVANSLKITGASGGAARAAILQLGHAFETGRVTAREFNGLALNAYPILQAAAAGSDKYGGSVAKLRAALLAGDLTSKEFFADVLAGSDQLAARAGKATLTTAQGFTALNNALIVYFGTADQAGGVSAAFGATLEKLAENLDIVIPAIAAIGVALGVGYVARAVAAARATQGLGAAVLGAFGGPVGLAITALTLTIGGFYSEVARHDAVIAKVNESFDQMQDRLQAVGEKAGTASSHTAGVGDAAKSAAPGVEFLTGKVRGLADELYRQADAAKQARIETARNAVKAAEKQEQASAQELPAERDRTDTLRVGGLFNPRNFGQIYRSAVGGLNNFFNGGIPDAKAKQAYAQARTVTVQAKADLADAYKSSNGTVSEDISPTSRAAVEKLQRQIDGLRSIRKGTDGKRFDKITQQIQKRQQQIDALNSGADSAAASASTYVPGSGRSGPSAETLAKRAEAARQKGVRDDRQFDSALRQAQSDQLSAQADVTNDAEARADIERQRVRFQAEQLAKEIASKGPGGTKEFTADEVAQLQGINARTADLRVASIDQAERRRKAEDARNLDRAGAEALRDQLQSQSQLAETLAERKRIALQLLDLDYQQREKELRAVLDKDSGASTGDRAVAQRRLDALPSQKAIDEKQTNRQNEGVGASYLRSLNVDRPQFIQSEEVKLLEGFNAGLDDSVKKALHLHGIFGDIIGDLIDMAIRQALIKPLAGALFGGGDGGNASGGTGVFSSVLSAIGGIFGGARAGGGPVAGGETYLVGEKGPELVTMGGNGHVYPNGTGPNVTASNEQARGGGQQVTVVAPQHFDLSNAVMTPQLYQQMNAISQHNAQQYASSYAAQGAKVAVRTASANLQSRQVLGTEKG